MDTVECRGCGKEFVVGTKEAIEEMANRRKANRSVKDRRSYNKRCRKCNVRFRRAVYGSNDDDDQYILDKRYENTNYDDDNDDFVARDSEDLEAETSSEEESGSSEEESGSSRTGTSSSRTGTSSSRTGTSSSRTGTSSSRTSSRNVKPKAAKRVLSSSSESSKRSTRPKAAKRVLTKRSDRQKAAKRVLSSSSESSTHPKRAKHALSSDSESESIQGLTASSDELTVDNIAAKDLLITEEDIESIVKKNGKYLVTYKDSDKPRFVKDDIVRWWAPNKMRALERKN